MLEPQSRLALLESLAPPPGYVLDRAIGTTFTLDLLALLTVPLGFSLLDAGSDDSGRPAPGPLEMLESARRHARRMTIFCDAGHIGVPAPDQPLYSLLEDVVVPVRAPRRGGLFHPKLWAIRYVAPDEPGVACVRILCATRNLTFDRSWDTLLALEGPVGDADRPDSAPLAEFISSLPGLAVGALPEGVSDAAQRMADDAFRTTFAAPPQFEELRFHPLGIGPSGADPLGGRLEPMLVISPFVGEAWLESVLERSDPPPTLVSRAEELERIQPAVLDRFAQVLVLNDLATDEPVEDVVAAEPTGGLHAKLYLADRGWNAALWTGSANATEAAFAHNVEFLVELRGKKSMCGIGTVLREGASSEAPRLRDILEPYKMHTTVADRDEESERVRALLDLVRGILVAADLRVHVEPAELGFRLDVLATGEVPTVPPGVAVRLRPISLGAGHGQVLGGDPSPLRLARFAPLGLSQITGFIAAELLADGDRNNAESLVLNLPVTGAPADRQAAIIGEILRDRHDVLRFLLMLLAADERNPSQRLDELGRILRAGWGDASAGPEETPLLEPLLQVLARDPERIDEVARLVDDLRALDDGAERLPPGFDLAWESIARVREELR